MHRTFSRRSMSFGAPEALREIDRRLARVLINQRNQEKAMATNQEAINNLRREIEESRAETAETLEAIQRVVTYVQSVPAMVQDAVRKATEANPGADLTDLSLLANELNAQQSQLDEAQLAINGVLSTTQAPLPEVEPTPPAEPVEPTGEGEFLAPGPTDEGGEGNIG